MAEDNNSVTTSNDSASVTKPEDTSVSQSATNQSESLNFKELLTVPKTQDERNGMSRREWKKEMSEIVKSELARANGQKTEDDSQEIEIDEDKLLSKLDEKFGFSKINDIEQRTKSSDIESYFNKTLEGKGISPKDFNTTFKPIYDRQFKSLVQDGLDPHKAARYALDFAVQGYEGNEKVKESNKRAEARSKIKTSPDSAGIKTISEITENEMAQLSQKDYNAIRERIQKGEVKIVRE